MFSQNSWFRLKPTRWTNSIRYAVYCGVDNSNISLQPTALAYYYLQIQLKQVHTGLLGINHVWPFVNNWNPERLIRLLLEFLFSFFFGPQVEWDSVIFSVGSDLDQAYANGSCFSLRARWERWGVSSPEHTQLCRCTVTLYTVTLNLNFVLPIFIMCAIHCYKWSCTGFGPSVHHRL